MRQLLLGLAAVVPLLCSSASADEFEIDAATSTFHVIIYKDGLLGKLGHDHVLDAPDLRGRVNVWGSSSTLHLEINTAGLEIDREPARLAEGYQKQVGDSDREKIKRGMRGEKGLDVRRYPLITVDSTSIEKLENERGMWMVSANLTLHGATKALELPVTMTEAPGGFRFSGYVRIKQSDFGVKPASAAGGLIRSADEVLVKFNLAAKPTGR